MRAWFPVVFAMLGSPVAAQQTPGDTVEAIPTCLPAVQDQATGSCVGVSTIPTLGLLYPLGPDFYFDAFGTLQMTGSLATPGGVVAQGGFSTVGDVVAGGIVTAARIGAGTSSPAAGLHVRSNGPAELLLEADVDQAGPNEPCRAMFSDRGGLFNAIVGFQVGPPGADDLSLRALNVNGGINFDINTSTVDGWDFRRVNSLNQVDVEARFTFDGNLQLDGSVSSPAADLAEYYPVARDVEPGDVVAFTGEGLALERARAGAQGRLAGVVSSRPAFVMGLSYTRADELGVAPPGFLAGDGQALAVPSGFALAADELAEPPVDPPILHEIEVNGRAPLALSGRIPCKVTAANGPIHTGDLLTASWVAGHAMRATEAGPVIGTALEDCGAGEGTILVLPNLGWFSPDRGDEIQALKDRVAELEAAMRSVLASR